MRLPIYIPLLRHQRQRGGDTAGMGGQMIGRQAGLTLHHARRRPPAQLLEEVQ